MSISYDSEVYVPLVLRRDAGNDAPNNGFSPTGHDFGPEQNYNGGLIGYTA